MWRKNGCGVECVASFFGRGLEVVIQRRLIWTDMTFYKEMYAAH